MRIRIPFAAALVCLLVLLTCPATADDKDKDLLNDTEIRKCLDLVNAARKASGLDEVRVSPKLSIGCGNHAKYMVLNRGNPKIEGLKAHEEDKSLKGYTPEGAAAAESSVMHFVKPSLAVEGWLSTFYHRVPLLQANLKEVGIGYYTEKDYTVAVLDCVSGTDGEVKKEVVFFPEDGQKGLPIEFYPEVPNPIPEKHKGKAGSPVTVMFAMEKKVKDVRISLSDARGKAVESFISTPEKPATTEPQWNSIVLIPQRPLMKSSDYTVELSCEVDGKKFSRKWGFQTAK